MKACFTILTKLLINVVQLFCKITKMLFLNNNLVLLHFLIIIKWSLKYLITFLYY